jgi:phosphoribosylglycinamide formyltransferase-1
VLAGDTAETLAARVLEAEHHLYPHALALVASGAVFVKNERVIDGNDQAQVPLFSPPLA